MYPLSQISNDFSFHHPLLPNYPNNRFHRDFWILLGFTKFLKLNAWNVRDVCGSFRNFRHDKVRHLKVQQESEMSGVHYFLHKSRTFPTIDQLIDYHLQYDLTKFFPRYELLLPIYFFAVLDILLNNSPKQFPHYSFELSNDSFSL